MVVGKLGFGVSFCLYILTLFTQVLCRGHST